MSKQNKVARKLAEGREHSARRVAERAERARKAEEEKQMRQRLNRAADARRDDTMDPQDLMAIQGGM